MASHELDPKTDTVEPRRSRRRGLKLLAGASLCGVAVGAIAAGCGSDGDSSGFGAAFPSGTPSVVEDNQSGFPAPNYDLANTREIASSGIDSETVGSLEQAWAYDLTGESTFGVFSSNPIVTGDTVYLQDINSNVFAVSRDSGELLWERKFDSATTGPNGVALADGGVVVGGTATDAFGIDAETGEVLWQKNIIQQPSEGVDIAPTVWNDTVIISSVPGASLSNFYGGGGRGIVYAFDVQTGDEMWSFDTTEDPETGVLWGNREVNSGGGLWAPPSVDDDGNVYMAVANPGPWPGVEEFPNGSSRPGDNLYTNSLVVVDGETGEYQWHWQAIAHDLRDWDLHLGPILTTLEIDGEDRHVALLSGKMGTVYALDTESQELLWETDVGLHTPEAGAGDGRGVPDRDGPDRNAPFRQFPTTVYPGWLGGVETAMALSDGMVYVPVNNLCSVYLRQGNFTEGSELCDFGTSSGEIVALDAATGEVVWKQDYDTQNYGGATVVNDLVVTVDFNGLIRAHDKTDGTEVWSQQLPAQSNSTPAVTDDSIIAGAGFASSPDMSPQVVSYQLPSGS